MKNYDFDYNSQREDLVISEYGRHIQNLINYAKTIAEKEERQLFAESIANLMLQIFPQTKNVEDYKEKIWKHIFRIADYEIDVDPPDGLIISRPPKDKRPEMISYPTTDTKYRHYGNHVQHLINKACLMEDEEMRDEFVRIIGAYMKMAYRNWNREHFVSDEIVKQDIVSMSKGKLKLDEDTNIDHHFAPPTHPKRRKRPPTGGPKRHNYRSNQRRR